MAAVNRTIFIDQGATFPLGFVYCRPLVDGSGDLILDGDGNPQAGDPEPLTGALIRMQIREKIASPTYYVQATSEDQETVDGVDNGGGRIFIESGSETGRVDIVLTDEDTMAIPKTKAVYDVELVWPIQSGELRPRVERILEGSVVIDLNVTRDSA